MRRVLSLAALLSIAFKKKYFSTKPHVHEEARRKSGNNQDHGPLREPFVFLRGEILCNPQS